MPSNYTIAKNVQRIIYYRQICGRDTGCYTGVMLEVQRLAGVRLDELVKTDWSAARPYVNEADEEGWKTLAELARGEPPSVLVEESVPLTILELTEIKGVGAKLARRAYDELGIADFQSLQAAVADGRIAKVKGFGPAMIEKIKLHGAKKAKPDRKDG